MSNRIQPVESLKEYFKDALHAALVNQHPSVEGETEHYVVTLLTLFARSEALFEPAAEGPPLKPLVVLLSEAIVGTTVFRRRAWRAYLWPSIALGGGVLLWVIVVFSTFSPMHLLAHAVWDGTAGAPREA